MKKIVVLGLVALWSVGLVRAAADFTVGVISYKIIEGTNVEVTAGTSPYTGAVVIPSSVVNEGTTYIVTAIGNTAFDGCSDLTSVTIPTSVESIGNTAFNGCSGLTSVEIPNFVTSIGNFAFNGCSGLSSVTIPDAVTSIGQNAFRNCSGLTSVTIGNSVEAIAEYTFEGCSNLASVTIGSAVRTIGNYAFKECSGLTSVTIPNSVASIGLYAFYNCSGLTSVEISNSVTTIWDYAFRNCHSLTSVHYTGNIAQWCAISKKSDWISKAYDFYADGKKVTDLVIPESVTSLGNYAFYNCSGLTSVEIPNSVTSIGNHAFHNCSGLTSVEIPNSVTSIGNSAFHNCSGLTSVEIPDSVTIIGWSAFSGCRGLTSLTIGRSVSSIDMGAFKGCSLLEKIYAYALVPPALGSDDVFNGVEIANVHLYVPQGSVADYKDAEIWKGFQIAPFFTVTVSANDGSVGTVTGGGIYGAGETARLTATATVGYGFVKWSDGETANPRTVTVTSDSAFVAEFAKFYTVTVSANDASMGTVSGGGEFESGATATLTATPNTGCKFVKWRDGETANPRTVTVISDTTFKAEFAKEIYTVTVSANDATMGTVTGGGEFESGATATLTATPKAGCKFVKWRDGETANPRTVTVTSDTTFVAEFAKDIYTVTVSANDASMGTVTGGGEFESGATATLMATPKAGCKFVKWSDGETANPRTVTVTSDTTFVAEFAKEIYTITVSVNDESMGTVTGGGSYESGATAALTATPKAGCKFVKWSDGATANPRTVTVTSDTTFKAEFAKEIYTVTVSANDETMGTVTGGGEFESGAMATLTATPKAGCKFVKWSDGETANPRTVAVTSNLTLVAEFAKEDVAIEDLSGRDRIVVMSSQGKIQVQGAEGLPVSVYDMSGICLFRGNGRALMEVAVPAPGIYIVKAGAQTVKVAVCR